MAELQSLATSFEEDAPQIGTTLKSCSPAIAEALGFTPLEFLFVDRQHGFPVSERLEHVVRAADLHGLPVVVRVPKDDLSMITYFLDIGVSGVMLPQIEDPEILREASEHVRYHDGRSIATTSRAAGFGKIDRDQYVEHVNEELALIPQIETEAGVEVVDEVARLEASTAVAIGPGDLAKSMGVTSGGVEVKTAVDDIFDTVEANGCRAGTFVGDESGIDRYADRAAFVICNSDIGLLMSQYDDLLADNTDT